MQTKEIWRWATVLLFGGCGVYLVEQGLWHAVSHWDRDWAITLFVVLFTVAFSGLPLLIAYFAYRRQYRRIANLAVGLGTFVLFGELSRLVRLRDFDPLLNDPRRPWLPMVGLLLGILPLVVPTLFFRWGVRKVNQRFPELPPTEQQIARTLRWNRRLLPIRRGMLRTGIVVTGLLVGAAVLVFVGVVVQIWMFSNEPVLTGSRSRDAFAWFGDPYGGGFIVLVGSLFVFLVSWIVRGEWRTRLRELPTAAQGGLVVRDARGAV